MNNNPLIVGLTGSFGSGCSYIAKEILSKNGYQLFSLSDVLKKMYQKEMSEDPSAVPRKNLQDFGDKKRREGGEDYFAREVIGEIEKRDLNNDKYVIDSIRNPAEVSFFRGCSSNFFLFGIYADEEIRWSRVKDKPAYNDNHSLFVTDDKNDKGKNNPIHGQHVEDCFYEADVVIKNDEDFSVPGNERFQGFQSRFLKYVELVSNPLKRQRPIKTEESLMASAYAISQRSSCMRRKVGAVLVDEFDNIISSGFNEVPNFENPCEQEYKGCFREKMRNDFFSGLDQLGPADKVNDIKTKFKTSFKNLDYCRALHAEENAIVNIARNGCSISLEKCTLYSTTYPCRMCANKIVQAGIKHVHYLEPYPDADGKAILKQAGVDDKPFEGVTFKAYFRLYGERK